MEIQAVAFPIVGFILGALIIFIYKSNYLYINKYMCF